MQRDPLGYVDGMSVYAGYSILRRELDPSGTTSMRLPSKPDISFAANCSRIIAARLPRMLGAYARMWESLIHTFPLHAQSMPHQHCFWNCRMTRDRGADFAEIQSQWKEELDYLWAEMNRALTLSGCKASMQRIGGPFNTFVELLEGHARSAFQPADFQDNATGRKCGDCEYEDLSCIECCTKLGIPPNAGDGPDNGRPWGPFRDPKSPIWTLQEVMGQL